MTIGVSPARANSADWPNSYSYRILDAGGKQIGAYGVISTFDCVRRPGEVGPAYCGWVKIQIPAGGSVAWTLPLINVPSDRADLSVELELAISVLRTNSTDVALELHAVRTFLIRSSDGGCVYAVGV